MSCSLCEDIDADWEKFLNNDLDSQDTNNNNTFNKKEHNAANMPKCSDIYISTKTKISYLNKDKIDIKNIFWKIPIISYATTTAGAIKKQIKFSTLCPEQLEEVKQHIKREKYVEEQIIEHIENPDGRIKFKDQRKISVGICKKNILNFRCKEKRAFFNCFVLILRVKNNGRFKEMHVKVFNTGKLEIPGIQCDIIHEKTLNLLVELLKPHLGEDLTFDMNKNETVLINSNFNCGYFIDRDKLYDILKYKYNINSNFDSCSYPGIQCKFYYLLNSIIQTGQQPNKDEMNCQGISFMIFRTGSVLIVGKCTEDILYNIYEFLKKLLHEEYIHVGIGLVEQSVNTPKEKKRKIRKKIIIMEH